MSISMKAKLTAACVAASLAGSYALAEKLDYVPADPDSYPYPSETVDEQGNKINIDGAIKLPQELKVDHVYHSPHSAEDFDLGKKATKEQVEAWNTDVRPDGKGLPEGGMSVGEGFMVYSEKCATCHGDFGEGVDRFPVLSGGFGTLTLKPETGGDPGPVKTVGSYLPYIAPLYWYIQTAMPLSSPKSLTDDEVYGIIGYILQVNDIKVKGEYISDDTVIDAEFIKSVEMPNEDGFEYNNLRKPDTQNTRCMENCLDWDNVSVKRIETDGTQVEPPFGEERYYYGEVKPKGEEDAGPGKEGYETYCAGCHDSGLAGSPKIGDKKAWAKITKKDMQTVYGNAINGKGAMPPKGGAANLSEDEVKEIVDYMIQHSK